MDRHSKRSRSAPFNSNGASFIEILIALSIVLVSALAAGSFFSQQISSTRNVTKISACKAALDSQLTAIRQLSAAAPAFDWEGKSSSAGGSGAVGAGAGNNVTVDSSGVEDPWIDPTLRAYGATTDVLKSSGAGPHELNTHLLQRGSMGFLAALYNGVPGICTGVDMTSIPHVGEALPAPVADDLLNNFKATVQINPFNLGSGATDSSCQEKWARPQGFAEAAMTAKRIGKYAANTAPNIGYRVKLQGSFQDASGAMKTCDATEDFSYPVDLKPQRLSVVINVADPLAVQPSNASAYPGARAECSHPSGTAAALNLEIGFSGARKMDPGTVFLCRDMSKQINPNYCTGAPNAAMKGSTYDASTMPAPGPAWVPCNEVTACGIKPKEVTYAKASSTEVKYRLAYDNSTSPSSNPDGLWGCDIKMDVATVDAAGNFEVLSEQVGASAPPLFKAYYQPVSCYACYKKKPFNFLTLALVVGAAAATGGIGGLTAIGTAAAAGTGAVAGLNAALLGCVVGVGGFCRIKGARFMYNRCNQAHPPSGKKFCRKLTPTLPAWFKAQANISTNTGCAAVTLTGPNGQPYTLDATDEGGIAETTAIHPNGNYCEAQAFCEKGKFVPVTDPADPASVQAATPIATCGSFWTMKILNDDDSTTPSCLFQLPSDFDQNKVIRKSYYESYPVQTCSVGGQISRCAINESKPNTDPGHFLFPDDALDRSQKRSSAPYLFFDPYNSATDSSLPFCSGSP